MNSQPVSFTDIAGSSGLAELYRELAPGLRGFCNRILNSEASASDATHEAFARVLAHKPVLPSKADFRRYMYRVSLNICLNELRRRRTVAEDDVPLLEMPASVGESAEVDRLFAHRVLAACSERVRSAAVLCLVEEHGCDETAALMGCSRRCVYNWMQRLKQIAHGFLEEPLGTLSALDGA